MIVASNSLSLFPTSLELLDELLCVLHHKYGKRDQCKGFWFNQKKGTKEACGVTCKVTLSSMR